MAAKDKAKELFDKMYKSDHVNSNYPMCFDSAKECALIAIDEMLDIRNGLYLNEDSIIHQYLMDVKQEILKL